MEVSDEGEEARPGDGDDAADGGQLPPPDGSSIGRALFRKRQCWHSNSGESRRSVGEGAGLGRRNVAALGDEAVRKVVEKWKEDGKLLPMRKSDAGMLLVVVSSPRFAVYENDMGWGRPVAQRMGQAKYDGGAWAFPGREDVGSIDFDDCLASATMDRLVSDDEFMQYVSH